VELAHAGDDRLWTRKVGSSSARRWIALDSFSWSDFVFGSMACSMTGFGKVIDSRTIGLAGSQRVSPVVVSLRPMTAQIMPAPIESISSRLLACIW